MDMHSASVKTLFAQALEIDSPAERMAYLDKACAGNQEVRRQVEALLKAFHDAGSFLESPPGNGTQAFANILPVQEVAEQPGTVVGGRYKLLEQIGAGGMGVVFMAEQQEPVRRLVALKIIKPGMDSGQVLARFEAERQALALMDHPNIAKVLDAGSIPSPSGRGPGGEGGRPYFVMELVKGTPITKFCDERRLAPRQRLELFVLVCQALQHAHQKGVIHRDIKPSNVLVALYDDKPVPKVIDFGVAKAAGQPLTEKTLNTGFGAIVGTPEYMSPEQATFNQLDIDTRSDVYALGVLLYELLTGNTPVDKVRLKEAALLEVLRVVREEEPPRPSVKLSTAQARGTIAETRGTEADKLAQLLRGELDWIVMKSLEKDRNRRYDTAANLARDVERYLKDELVEARPPSAGYRLKKFVKRHRGPVLAGTLLLLALVAGIIGTTIGLVRAVKAEQAADAARLEAEHRKGEAVFQRIEAVEQRSKALANEKKANAEALAAKEAREKAEINAQEAKQQALRADTSRHAIQMDAIFRAWERDDMLAATKLLGEAPEAFRQTWEYRYLRDLCHRKALPMQFLADLRKHGSPGFPTISPDGKTIAASYDCLRIFDTATGQEKWSFGQKAYPFHSIYSRDSKLIAFLHSGGAGYSITICNLETGQQRFLASPGPSGVGGVPGCAFSPDGKFLAATVYNGVIVFDVAIGKQKYRIDEPKAIQKVAFSDDGKLLAASGPIAVKIYDAENGAEKITVSTSPHDLETNELTFSPDGKHLLAARAAARFSSPLWRVPWVMVWDTQTGKERFATPPDRNDRPRDFGFTADGKAVVMVGGSRDGSIFEQREVKLLDLASGHEMPAKIPLGRTTCKSLDPEGRRIVIADRKNVYLWALGKTPLESAALELEKSFTFSRYMGFNADGNHLFGDDTFSTAFLWDARTGRKVRAVKMDNGGLFPRGFSPDGLSLACSIIDFPTFKVFNTVTGKERLSVPCGRDTRGVKFSPNGKWVVSWENKGGIKLWDAATGELKSVFEAKPSSNDALAFSSDGRLLAKEDGEEAIAVWDTQTGVKTCTIKRGETFPIPYLSQLFFFKDGRRLLSVHHFDERTNEIKVWNVATGKLLAVFSVERNRLNQRTDAVLSPDGSRLFFGNSVIDVEMGQQVFTFPQDFMALAVSPDGGRLLGWYGDHAQGRVGIFAAP